MQYQRNYLEISLKAISHNLDVLRQCNAGCDVMAVIKANGYGHGAVQIARIVGDRVRYFGVATAEEGYALREDGIAKPILLLGCADRSQYESLIRHAVTVTVFRASDARALSDVAVAMDMTATVHIAVDTGMSRIGLCPCEESIAEIEQIVACPHLKVEGIFSHLSCADEEERDFSGKQIRAFVSFLHRLADREITFALRHLHNSAGLMEYEIPECNMVRAGIALYGIYPSDSVSRDSAAALQPALAWYTTISYLKRVPAGTPVSYGATFVTARETAVATVPVGYADGYPRTLSGCGEVLIGGRRAPIIGRICMDQMMVDVTDLPEVCEGSRVTLLGSDGNERISLEELAIRSGRFFYEFPCLITDRVPRILLPE